MKGRVDATILRLAKFIQLSKSIWPDWKAIRLEKPTGPRILRSGRGSLGGVLGFVWLFGRWDEAWARLLGFVRVYGGFAGRVLLGEL